MKSDANHALLVAGLLAAAAGLPPTLTVAEAAEFARVCRKTIYRWIDEGRLLAAKTSTADNGRLLITKSALVQTLVGAN